MWQRGAGLGHQVGTADDLGRTDDREGLRASTDGVTSPGAAASVPRVFLVDDNDRLRESLRDLLADAGIAVVGEAADSLDALRRIPSAAYLRQVVVLMDVRLPGPINGIEATRLVIDRCQHVAVIIFTAFPSAGIEEAARKAGAVDLLAKGCPAGAIVDAVKRAWTRTAAVGGLRPRR